MSHTTELKTVAIRDESAIQTAVAKLKAAGINIALVQHERPRMYFRDQVEECEYVLKLEDGKYDVGLKLQENGTYAPIFDEYQGHVGGQIGADANVCPIAGLTAEQRAQHQIGQFVQAYTEAATINAAVAQGYSVDSTHTDEEGNVHLTLSGM